MLQFPSSSVLPSNVRCSWGWSKPQQHHADDAEKCRQPALFVCVVLLLIIIVLQCQHILSQNVRGHILPSSPQVASVASQQLFVSSIKQREVPSPRPFRVQATAAASSERKEPQTSSNTPNNIITTVDLLSPSSDVSSLSAPSEPITSVLRPSSVAVARVPSSASRRSNFPSEVAPLFPSIYYVYDLDDLNSAILTNFTLAYPGKHPASFEHDDFRQHISEYFMARDVAKYAQVQRQYLCAQATNDEYLAIPSQYAKSRFTHDPRVATHFIIPALLTVAKRTAATHTDDVLEQLIQALSKPIQVSDPCNPQVASVEVPSPFLARHGRDHLLLIGGPDIQDILGTRRQKWETPLTETQVARAAMFEDCTFFNLEKRFLQRLHVDFINYYKSINMPYDPRAHVNQFIPVPYTPHFALDEGLDHVALWLAETRAEISLRSPKALSSDSSTKGSLTSSFQLLQSVLHQDSLQDSTPSLSEEERLYVSQLPVRPNLFTLRCTVFDKGHETRTALFRMMEEDPVLSGFQSLMQKMNDVQKEDKSNKTKPKSATANGRPLKYPTEAYVDSLLQSDFCLIPKGDTPSSRRLYDAILTACIPVIISDKIELPFDAILQWSAFSVRLSEEEILKGNATSLIELSRWSTAKKHAYRMSLLRVRQHFDWNGLARDSLSDAHFDRHIHQMMQPIDQVYTQLYQKEYQAVPNLHRYSAVDMLLLQHQAAVIATEKWRNKRKSNKRDIAGKPLVIKRF